MLSVKSAVKSNCIKALDVNRLALVKECSLPAVSSYPCKASTKVIEENRVSRINGARVSKAKGTKQYGCRIPEYLADFLSAQSAAISVAVPSDSVDRGQYDSAKVSMTVASQARHFHHPMG